MLPALTLGGRPHWEARFPEEVWPAFEDFRNFLALTWDHLGLPEPTRAQFEIAHRLQYGADSVEWVGLSDEERVVLLRRPRKDVVRAFRALGKSYTVAAYVIWRLMRNPRDEKVLVVSATGKKSKEFVSQVKGILESMPLVQWLLEGNREGEARRRDEADQFDVAGGSLSQSHSVKAVGITGQISGSRATLIVSDDIEIVANSRTEDGRGTILNAIRSDFPFVAKTEHGEGDIIFLGTPQTEESIYNVLVTEMGYTCFCIPARFPTAEKLEKGSYRLVREGTKEHVNILAPYLLAAHSAGELPFGAPTDTRFSAEELLTREAEGRSHFALHMMLDTSLSDAERYPLKQHDLIVFAVNAFKAPLTIQWGHDTDRKNYIGDIPNLGFNGDHFLRPLMVDLEWRDYEGGILFVDPAGRGKDEVAWAVVRQLGGTMYVMEVDGHRGDPAEAMLKIAVCAKKWDVDLVEVEPNFGQGMWTMAFQPIVTQVWSDKKHVILDPSAQSRHVLQLAKERDKFVGGCSIQESEWAKGQKELRIIDTLEPVLTTHRLVIDETVVRREARQEDRDYSLLYQLTHITRERGALRHDDRLDALAGAVAHFMSATAIDPARAAQAVRDQEFQEMMDDFEECAALSPLGMRRGRGKRRADGSRGEVFSLTI